MGLWNRHRRSTCLRVAILYPGLLRRWSTFSQPESPLLCGSLPPDENRAYKHNRMDHPSLDLSSGERYLGSKRPRKIEARLSMLLVIRRRVFQQALRPRHRKQTRSPSFPGTQLPAPSKTNKESIGKRLRRQLKRTTAQRRAFRKQRASANK